jgi:gamma-glutamyltranspeptidase/glutathione hydrolase
MHVEAEPPFSSRRSLVGPFGVMGGFMQPQGHIQVVVALADDGTDPQAALDRPRFFAEPAGGPSRLQLEEGVPDSVTAGLRQRGHRVRAGLSGHGRALFGRGQIVLRDDAGVLWGGSDPRADGCARGF